VGSPIINPIPKGEPRIEFEGRSKIRRKKIFIPNIINKKLCIFNSKFFCYTFFKRRSRLDKPFFTVSGLRGIVGKSLTPPIVISYTKAFFSVFGPGLYIVGRDTRPHGEMISQLVKGTLLALGADVLDIGIVPTPTVVFTVRDKGARGGIVITASHNPIEWNALKFIDPSGRFPFQREIEEIEAHLEDDIKWSEWRDVGNHSVDEGVGEKHIERIIENQLIDPDLIKRKNLTVAIDSVNGATYRLLPELLKRLGCRVIEINCESSGFFPHNPEPRKENLKELDDILKNGEADLGFASDPDGDRISIGIKKRGIIGEEYTFPLATEMVLEKRRGPVVTNLSTSMLIETTTDKFGVPLYRTPVGEANVVQEMIEKDAVMGGEGNGGVIFPEINLTRDGLVAVALITTLAAKENLESILNDYPSFYFLKEKFPMRGPFPSDKIKEIYKGGEIDERDGIHIRFEKSWVHIRPSNTEPIVRVYIEGENREAVQELFRKAERVFHSSSI
jgi:phosphomannomutase